MAKHRNLVQKSKFCPKIEILPKNRVFHALKHFFLLGREKTKGTKQNTKFRFLNKILIFEQNFDFWTKCLNKISIFEQNFDFWTKFLNKIFEQNTRTKQNTKFRFFNKIRGPNKIQNFDFWIKFRFLNKISIFA